MKTLPMKDPENVLGKALAESIRDRARRLEAYAQCSRTQEPSSADYLLMVRDLRDYANALEGK